MTRIDTLELFDDMTRAMNGQPEPLFALGDIDVVCLMRVGAETERVRIVIRGGRCAVRPARAGDERVADYRLDADVRTWGEIFAGTDPARLRGVLLDLVGPPELRKTG